MASSLSYELIVIPAEAWIQAGQGRGALEPWVPAWRRDDNASDGFAAGVRGVDREGPPAWPRDLKGVVDAAALNRRGPQPFCRIVAMSRVDIVDHQVERRERTGRRRRLGLAHDDMRPAAQFQHRKVFHLHDWPQADRFQPARRRRDITAWQPHMADRD